MQKGVLITGGAGFIGSHVADCLLQRGHRVRVLDCLLPQVHGPKGKRPDYLHPEIELQIGDVRDPQAVRRALCGMDAVFHFAARVGVGQSMHRISDYADHNVRGTAVLMEALMAQPVKRLVVASSMSIYGEGLYRDRHGRTVTDAHRSEQQLREGRWELHDDRGVLRPVPTPEWKRPALASVYALSKYDQEIMSLVAGRSCHIPTVALRFFNVYGERQSLANPYSGILTTFAARMLSGKRPLIYEDGLQMRDFVSVHDVAQACLLALDHPAAVGEVLNVGSGHGLTIRDLAAAVARALRCQIAPDITDTYRTGDIRHCFSDITKAKNLLGYTPQVSLDDGIAHLSQWLAIRHCMHDAVDERNHLKSAR